MNQALREMEVFSEQLMVLFEEMGICFSEFQKQNNLSCPSTCGHCCTYPHIEATPKEMIPMALYFFKRNEAEAVLKKIEDNPKYCVNYVYDSHDHDKGRCGHYLVRPSLCRMFGVYGYNDKNGKKYASACKLLKPLMTEKTIEDAPLMIEWSYKMMSLDPKLVTEKMPINLALKKALEEVLFKAQFE